MIKYDYIIIGAGAAGLMLADAMGKDNFFADRSILLLDKDAKQTNDRTWCFWEKGVGEFDTILYKKWSDIYFAGGKLKKQFSIHPYAYKMVRGIDFYTSYLERNRNYPNITFKQETVLKIAEEADTVLVSTENTTYTGKQVFNSIFDYKTIIHQEKYPVLKQHFIGWFVKTQNPVFDVGLATLMDFSVPQKGNTRFMYVLPFSETEALVEYTLFSEKLLPENEYEEAISHYMEHNLGVKNYEITDKEKGSIPMTCYNFKKHQTANMLYIGTAGGWSKPSTGYTFLNTAKKIPLVIEYLKTGKPLNTLNFKSKFWYYDLLLLDVLHKENDKGHTIFESLFKKRRPQDVFKFLGEETTFWEDIKIMTSAPQIPFIKALLKRLF